MLDLLYNGMGIRARVCVSPLSSYLYIISMVVTADSASTSTTFFQFDYSAYIIIIRIIIIYISTALNTVFLSAIT